jgi:hypothetical protein
MALMRATPTTVLPTVRQMAGELLRAVTDAGTLSAVPDLARQVERVEQFIRSDALPVDVRLPCPLDALSVQLQDFLSAPADAPLGQPVDLRFTGAGVASREAGEVLAPILTWVAAREEKDVLPDALRQAASNRPLVLLVGPGASVARQLVDDCWCLDVADADAPGLALRERIDVRTLGPARDALRAEAAASALHALVQVFRLAHDIEAKAVRGRRLLVQPAPPAPPTATTRATSDLLAEVRARLQRQITDLSRGVEDRLVDALAPGGGLWRAVEEGLEAITALDEEPRLRTCITRVADDELAEWTRVVRGALAAHLAADLVAIRDLSRDLASEIERSITASGGPTVVVTFAHVDEARVRRILDQVGPPSRRYQGELPRPGVFEYLMMARRYQMVLFMCMSAFGLSFLRNYREVMVPLAIVLFSLGGINVWNTVNRERIERRERELEKARDLLRQEARRMLADAQRAWTSLVSQHLGDQVALVTARIEAPVRDAALRLVEEAGRERQRAQRQVQGYETMERRLAAAARSRDLLSANLSQLRGELRQLVTSLLRARPAA